MSNQRAFMAVIHCPHCRKAITAPAGAAGRKALCPHCRVGFVIGGARAQPSRRWTWIVTGAAIAVGFVATVFAGKIVLGKAEPRVVRADQGKQIIVVVDPPKADPPKKETKLEPKIDPKPASIEDAPTPTPQKVKAHEKVAALEAPREQAIATVAYPAPRQTDVPLSFSGGPEADDASGFPISLQFPLGKTPQSVAAFLTDERGNRIPVSLSTPDQPLPGVRRAELVGMIPKRPLAPKSTYRVHFSGKLDEHRFEREWDFTTENDGDESGDWADKTLKRLNRIREQAGLEPVFLDEELSQACRAHAKYLVLNARRPEAQGLGVHREDSKFPGFTPEGQKAAKASDIALGDYEPIDAIEGWMATLYHRVPILEPGLKRVGFGCARGERLGWVSVLDVQSGRDKMPRPGPVVWPVDGQIDVPLSFPPGGELPNPIPLDKTGRAGYPITAFFPKTLFKAEAKLETAKGQPIPCWFSSPESPANPDFAANQGTTVCLIPKANLQPEQTYRVTMKGELDGRKWQKSWSFTCAKAGSAADDAVRLAVARLNSYRVTAGLPKVALDAELSNGCQAHADYLVRHASRRGAKGFSMTDENLALPGASAAGQKSAQRSDTFWFAPSSTTQIDDLIGTLSRRAYVLDPRLRRIGLGCSLEIGQGWINVLDLNSGLAD